MQKHNNIATDINPLNFIYYYLKNTISYNVLIFGRKIKKKEENILSKTAKTRFAILENRKKKQGKDDRKKKKRT